MRERLYFWVERYLFAPSSTQKLLSYALLPLTALYCTITKLKQHFTRPEDFGLPIISIGNLIVGGSGKTPLTIELAKERKNCAVILRGYGRSSQGLVVVSLHGKILTDVTQSGDEAMLLAQSLPKATVIVSEDRKIAIQKAKEIGIETIFLDDAFSKKGIKKFDILIKPDLAHIQPFCLPSGPYRESPRAYKQCDLLLKEGIDFQRLVTLPDLANKKAIFLTAISKPQRLLPYLPKDIPHYLFPDHAPFDPRQIQALLDKHDADTILTTAKDGVKLQPLGFEITIIALSLQIDPKKRSIIESFLEDFAKIA